MENHNILDKYQLQQRISSKKDWDYLYLAVGLGGEVGELQNWESM